MARYAVLPLDRNSFARSEEELHNEHAWLNQLAANLEAARNRTALLFAAEDLRRDLRLHFAYEEHPGGLYDSLHLYLPSYRGELAKMMAAHNEITITVHHLCQNARDREYSEAALRKDAARVADKLRRHEVHENQVAGQALGRAARQGKRPARAARLTRTEPTIGSVLQTLIRLRSHTRSLRRSATAIPRRSPPFYEHRHKAASRRASQSNT